MINKKALHTTKINFPREAIIANREAVKQSKKMFNFFTRRLLRLANNASLAMTASRGKLIFVMYRDKKVFPFLVLFLCWSCLVDAACATTKCFGYDSYKGVTYKKTKSYGYHSREKPKQNENPYVHRNLRLPSFNDIRSNGEFDLEVDVGSYGQRIEVSGYKKMLEATKCYVEGSTLRIATLCCPRSLRPKIRIHVPSLSHLGYISGSANIRVRGLTPSRPVAMELRGHSTVDLNGHIVLSQLVAGTDSQVNAYWIDGCEACIFATDRARICLGGNVDTLAITACGRAHVDARYVCARRAFVKTFQVARVDLRVIKSMNVLAADCSRVYYYQNPCFQAPFLSDGGAIIKMTQICCVPCWVCDNACCKNTWH